MESSILAGIILAIVMILLMLAPNYLFRVKNYDEMRDHYIKELIKHSEKELKVD